MKNKILKAGALGVFALSLGVGSLTFGVNTSPAWAEQPQTDSVVKIITRFRTLNPLSWDFQRWVWKTSFDGLHTTHLMAGHLDKGPLSGGATP